MSHTSLRRGDARGRCRRLSLLGIARLALGGCGSEQATTPDADESWYAISLGGLRAGFMHTRAQAKEEHGRQLLSVRQELQQDILRFGEPFEMKLVIDSLERPDGQLL